MLNHPSIQGRKLVVVGPRQPCIDFLDNHAITRTGVLIADTPRALLGQTPEDIHIIVMAGVLGLWVNPNAHLLRTEIALLHCKGATVEWA